MIAVEGSIQTDSYTDRDGNLGYITTLLLKKNFPESKVYIFGTNYEKLADFTFADGAYPVSYTHLYAFPKVSNWRLPTPERRNYPAIRNAARR